VIRVAVGDCQWLVARRYREFDDMHEVVSVLFDQITSVLYCTSYCVCMLTCAYHIVIYNTAIVKLTIIHIGNFELNFSA